MFGLAKRVKEILSKKRKPKEPVAPVEKEYSFNEELFDESIIYNENRGALARGDNLYEEEGETGDLGKYQTSPDLLSLYSKKWLGKKYTPTEYLKDPEAQEAFFKRFKEDVVKVYKLNEREASVAWHNGFGAIGFSYQTDENGKILKDENGVEIPVNYDYNRRKLIESIEDGIKEKDNVQEYIKRIDYLLNS